MAALKMTFTCDNATCVSEETCVADHYDAIKEDLEADLINRGWVVLRTDMGEYIYCSLTCMTGGDPNYLGF